MNLLLLEADALRDNRHAHVSGRQLEHIHQVLKLGPGDTLTVGMIGGQIGTGTIRTLSHQYADLDIEWHTEPPPALPLTLILGLPRPKMLKRIIQSCSTLGVKRLYLLNSWKVEKSYWQTPVLEPSQLREYCLLGLEQAKDTILPEVHLCRLFKPFVEDELADISHGTRRLLAHPGVDEPCPIDIQEDTTLVVGPEGGFTPYEVGKLEEAGFTSVHLGPRILRVETAVPVLLSRLFCQ